VGQPIVIYPGTIEMENFYVILSGSLLLLLLFSVWINIRLRRSNRRYQGSYAQGLKALMEGQREAALEHFKQTVIEDPNHIDAYLRIGDIQRGLGRFESAIKFHEQLLNRKKVTKTIKQRIYTSLVQDYLATGRYEKVLPMTAAILKINRGDAQAKVWEVTALERLNRWAEAGQKRQKRDGQKNPLQMALYRVEQGQYFLAMQDIKGARQQFEQAIRSAPESPAGYWFLAESYLQQGQPAQALKQYRRMAKKVTEYAALTFPRIQQILFEMGRFSELEAFYDDLLQQRPNDPHILLANAEYVEQKGDLPEAISQYEQLVAAYPENRTGWLKLIRCHQKNNSHARAAELAQQFITEQVDKHPPFACKVCDYQAKEPFWHCPQCQEWNSMIWNE
jgi:lipopolysaccharide biosynthesis regulator YciM